MKPITPEGIIPAETLVLNGTVGDNATAGGTLNQSVLWAAFRPNVHGELCSQHVSSSEAHSHAPECIRLCMTVF